MPNSISSRLKVEGNVNRTVDMHRRGFTAEEIRACFARGGLNIKVSQGDVPLIQNHAEFSRVALGKKVVEQFDRERQVDRQALVPAQA